MPSSSLDEVVIVVVVLRGGKEPSELGGVYAMTVYVFRRKGTPRIMSPTAEVGLVRTESAGWIMPTQNCA